MNIYQQFERMKELEAEEQQAVSNPSRCDCYQGLGVEEAVGLKNVGWISVKDQMPPDAQKVLVYDKNYGITTGDFDGNEWFMCCDEFEITMGLVTHWMPLPQRPVGRHF